MKIVCTEAEMLKLREDCSCGYCGQCALDRICDCGEQLGGVEFEVVGESDG